MTMIGFTLTGGISRLSQSQWYSDTPTKELRESPVILVGYDNYAKVEPVVGDEYYRSLTNACGGRSRIMTI